VQDELLWSMLEIQKLLDEWLIAKWQSRPHDRLRAMVIVKRGSGRPEAVEYCGNTGCGCVGSGS
jgi:hypothetical protein